MVAKFEWYHKRDPRVRATTVEQRWEHRDGDWRVVKLRRTRGERFGLVTEPIASTDAGAPAPPKTTGRPRTAHLSGDFFAGPGTFRPPDRTT